MNEWSELQLQDIVSILGDGLHGTPKYDDNGQYYFINGNNLSDGRIVIKSDTKKTTFVEYLKYKKNLNDRTILLSINGTLGNIAFYNGEKCVLGKSACYFNVLDTVNKDFIRYVVSNNHFQKHIKIFAHGTTIKNVSLKTVREYPFLLPPLPVQKSIATILSSLDFKIENLRQQNQTLEKIAQTLFHHWFVDFEFPTNLDSLSSGEMSGTSVQRGYKSSGGKMIASELGPIPEVWRVGVFNDFISKIIDNRGKTPPISISGILMMEGNQIFCDNAFPQYISTEKQKTVSHKTYTNWFRNGHPDHLDILCATVGTLPKWCFVPKDKKICIAQNIIAIRSKLSVCSPFFLRLYMNTNYFKKSLVNRLLTTAQPSIKVGHMTSIESIIPNHDTILEFNNIVKPVFIKIENNDNQIQTLTKTRDTLLPKLMSGEIRVPLEESC